MNITIALLESRCGSPDQTRPRLKQSKAEQEYKEFFEERLMALAILDHFGRCSRLRHVLTNGTSRGQTRARFRFFGRMRRMCKLEGAELAGAYSSFGACVVWGWAGWTSDGLETAILLKIKIYIYIFALLSILHRMWGMGFS